jgi:hypothetical protein
VVVVTAVMMMMMIVVLVRVLWCRRVVWSQTIAVVVAWL